MRSPLLPLALCSSLVGLSARADVVGRIRFEGRPPAPAALDMSADPVCHRLAHKAPAGDVQVAEGGLANVFVYLVDPPRRPHPAPPPLELVERACRLEPRVLGIEVGQKLVVANADPTLHSVRIRSQGGEVTRRLPKAGATIERRFTAPEVMARVTCDVHAWEVASIGIQDHPHFAVSTSTGAVRLPTAGLPDGAYRVGLWHETLGEQALTVQIAGGRGRIEASYPARR